MHTVHFIFAIKASEVRWTTFVCYFELKGSNWGEQLVNSGNSRASNSVASLTVTVVSVHFIKIAAQLAFVVWTEQ